jgi:aminopeptidase N
MRQMPFPALLLALALSVVGCAHAQKAAPEAPQVEPLLAHDPIDAAAVRALGPGAEGALETIATDVARPKAVRARAFHALAYVDAPSAQEDLRKASLDVHLDPELRLVAVHALLERAGRAGANLVEPVLADPDPKLRVEVAQALGSLGGPLARQVLEARLDKETDSAIREVLQKSLTEAQP